MRAATGGITFAEYNQVTQVRILQRMMKMEPSKPVDVFSNDHRLEKLEEFGEDIKTSAVNPSNL